MNQLLMPAHSSRGAPATEAAEPDSHEAAEHAQQATESGISTAGAGAKASVSHALPSGERCDALPAAIAREDAAGSGGTSTAHDGESQLAILCLVDYCSIIGCSFFQRVFGLVCHPVKFDSKRCHFVRVSCNLHQNFAVQVHQGSPQRAQPPSNRPSAIATVSTLLSLRPQALSFATQTAVLSLRHVLLSRLGNHSSAQAFIQQRQHQRLCAQQGPARDRICRVRSVTSVPEALVC